MAKNILKRDRKVFEKELSEFFAEYKDKYGKPVTPRQSGLFNHIDIYALIPTIYGDLMVKSIQADGAVYTVFAQFTDVSKLKGTKDIHGFSCNGFSGKWNIHLLGENWPAMDAVRQVVSAYSGVLEEMPNV